MKVQMTIGIFAVAVLTAIPSLTAGAQQPGMKFSKSLESDVTVVNVRSLNGGNALTSAKGLKFYRDTDGSTRLEAGSRVTIIDKQARKLYILNLDDRTAQEIDQPQTSIPNTVTRKRSVSINSLENSLNLSSDTLAPTPKVLPAITVEGFAAAGQEVSSTIPANSAVGNALPLTRTVQTWHSRELNLPLKTVIDDPIGGTTTSTYKNIKLGASLDRALFSIPPGYVVRYGTQSRVIHPQSQ
jgi:outer membrane lipoprotein-sorting protein